MLRMQSTSGGLLKDLFVLALLIVVIVIPLRLFVISPFVVDGESMHPTFENLDYLIIDEISYRFEAPQRGDVIVLLRPNPQPDLIKRIIGLPGDTIEVRNGQVYVNGVLCASHEPRVVGRNIVALPLGYIFPKAQ